MEKKTQNRKKYLLTCKAPLELTMYNKDWNNQVKLSCKHRYKHLFEPALDCQGCEHLEVKGYK